MEHDPFLSFASQSMCYTFLETFKNRRQEGPVSSSDAVFYRVPGAFLGLLLPQVSTQENALFPHLPMAFWYSGAFWKKRQSREANIPLRPLAWAWAIPPVPGGI